jgi:hypothetical protein
MGLLFTFDFVSLEDFPAMNDTFPTSTFSAGITPLVNSHVLASSAEFLNVRFSRLSFHHRPRFVRQDTFTNDQP